MPPPIRVLLIYRKTYLAHPRQPPGHRAARVIRNEADLTAAIQR